MKKPTHSPSRWLLALAACVAVSVTTSQAGTAVSAKAPKNPVPAAVDWKENTISPVANPIFFEDPIIRSEIRPIFAYHRIDPAFATGDGDAELYALQLRYAISPRVHRGAGRLL